MSGLALVGRVGHMATSRMIILGVAVAAAGGAGYVAKNMVASTPPEIIESAPQQPSLNLSDVLVLDGDVPMGQPLGDLLKWHSWPSDATNPTYITRDRKKPKINRGLTQATTGRTTTVYEPKIKD